MQVHHGLVRYARLLSGLAPGKRATFSTKETLRGSDTMTENLASDSPALESFETASAAERKFVSSANFNHINNNTDNNIKNNNSDNNSNSNDISNNNSDNNN